MKQLLLLEPEKAQSFDSEVWVDCPGFHRYEVSSNGRFRQKGTGKVMRQQKEDGGYPIVLLTRDGKQHSKLSHRLICEAFHGAQPAGKEMVNHINSIRDDNRQENLEWISRSGNAKHFWALKR